MPHPPHRFHFQSGFTMIEILVVMAIFVTIAGFTVFVSMDNLRSASYISERDAAVSILERARGESMNNINQVSHGACFDPANSQYVLFEGTSCAAGTNKINIPKESGGSVAVSWPGGVVFSQLRGASLPATITISDDAGHSSAITISNEGRINW